MFKACFKNFYKNIKYVFVEVGFMYIALLFGFEIFIKKLGIGFDQFKEAFYQMIEAQNPELIEEGLQKILESFSSGIVGFVAIQVIGLLVGFVLMMIMMKSDIERRNIFKVLLGVVIDAVVLAIFIAIILLLSSVATWGGVLAIVLFLPLYSLLTLLGSYVNHGLKLVSFKHVVSFRNIIKLSLCDILTIVFVILVGMLIALISNIIIGLTLMVALIMVGICIFTLNADSYVISLVENVKVNKKIEKAMDVARNTAITNSKDAAEQEPAEKEA